MTTATQTISYLDIPEDEVNEVIETSDGYHIQYHSDMLGFDVQVVLKDINYDIQRPEMIPLILIQTKDIQAILFRPNISDVIKGYLISNGRDNTIDLLPSLQSNHILMCTLSVELDIEVIKSQWFEKLQAYYLSDEYGFQED